MEKEKLEFVVTVCATIYVWIAVYLYLRSRQINKDKQS